ncbi:hypothetical protein OMP38_11630 [Cohnella ginsengisoli]|uniref:DUF6881 domain-containing protein n=1 Tax=Cohnella ginsengisoli TaxID=425004 RepID=A0A9X4KFU6_9BACL|nr:hypothetical protein [Cohnella ginsengisoli]MDG0791444.1 hypothetical protein [Cohnella ginsengisoli]
MFIKVIWFHQFVEEPVLLYSELDCERYEIRKIEFFRNNKVGFASEEIECADTALGSQPVPKLTEINKNNEFYGIEISKDEFEVIWKDTLDKLK